MVAGLVSVQFMPPVAASGSLELFLPHPPSGVPGGNGVVCKPVGTGTLNSRISGVVADAINVSLLSGTAELRRWVRIHSDFCCCGS